MVSLELLDRVETFKGMNDEQLEAIKANCEVVEFQRDDKLFTEGDDATHLWVVMEGDVDLRFELPGTEPSGISNMSSVSIVKEGVARILGWSCFVPPHKMRLSAFCASRLCKVLKVKKEALIELFKNDPQMGYLFMSSIVKVVGYRFHQFQDEVAKRRGEHIMSGW